MKTLFLTVLAVTSFVLFPRPLEAARVTLILRNIATDDFIEWRIKPAHRFTRTTGRLGRDSAEFEQTWDIGIPSGVIRFWWGRLSGEVDATLLVNDTIVFQGQCSHSGAGSVRMIDTCSYPTVYKTGGGGPYLVDQSEFSATHLEFATSMLGERFSVADIVSTNLLLHHLLPRN